MSIIERVAELLGPIERPKLKVFRSGRASSDLDAIERAVSESTERPGFPEARELAAQPHAKGLAAESKAKARPARPTSRTARTLRVDRNSCASRA